MISVKLVIDGQPDTNTNENCSKSAQYIQATAALTSTLASSSDIMFYGDYNLLNIVWPECTTKPGISLDECAMLKDTQCLCD